MDWGSIALVFISVLIAVVAIVAVYSLGLRLLAVGSPNEGFGMSESRSQRPVAATVGGFACIAVGVAAVLYDLYLVIPPVH